MKKIIIDTLYSGGLITNYYCSSKCRHCLYASGPGWSRDDIDKNLSLKILKKIKQCQCYSLHIGGGEPLLNSRNIFNVLDAFDAMDVSVEYIETNSSWYQNHSETCDLLTKLLKQGVNTLLISISPFHNEFVPFYKVKGVIKACQATGMNVFPWINDFYNDIDAFDDQKTHSLGEYQQKYGPDYIKKIPGRYWIAFRGRANKTFSKFFPQKSHQKILEENQAPCMELFETTHFHIDLYGNYIPGLCSGFSINYEELGEALNLNKYPILTCLMTSGINGFYKYTQKEFAFHPKETYISKCDLCEDIRKYLLLQKDLFFYELNPLEYYKQLQ